MTPAVAPRRPYHAAQRERGLGLPLLGLVMGALCGFFTYWGGAAILAYEDLRAAPSDELPYEFARPFMGFTYWELVLVAVGAITGAMVARYRWRSVGLLTYVGLMSLIAGYLVYTVTVSIPRVPPDERWLSYLLLAAEGGGLMLILVFSFYSLDAATRRRWTRVADHQPWDPALLPKVAFQVPVFNEDTAMVEETVAHLVRQDYPRDRFAVVVIDDSTHAASRARLAAFCERAGALYIHRANRRGYKAGALNHSNAVLPTDYELVAVIDADYWVAPDYLRTIVGYFADPTLSFVQTPQDYRNVDESFLTRQYKRAEAYFYHAIMPSRNEQSAIIFCGTMGILRRAALEQVGGFAEDQICEDAEVSVRLAAAGWNSLYVDRSFGRGLMPAVFDAYKKQFHRWAFGNVRIFWSHAGMILRSRMRLRQKIDFLVSNLHWFDGFFVMAVAGVLLYIGLGPILGYDASTHHQHELALLALVPIFLLVDSFVRLHLVLGRAGRVSFGQTLLVQGMWFAIKFTNMSAVLKSMLGFRSPFVRTPKDPGRRLGMFHAFFRAFWITKWETIIGSALLTAAGYNAYLLYLNYAPIATWLLPVWLAVYGMFYLCAPIYAYLSYRTLKPLRHQPASVVRPAGSPI